MPPTSFETHDVFNQPPQAPVRNAFETDPILYGALEPSMDDVAEQALTQHGTFWGSLEARELARLANANPPVLRSHDPYGRRIDLVEYHPAWHALMRRSAEAGLGVSVAERDNADEMGRQTALRAARVYITAEAEASHLFAWSATAAAASMMAGTPDLVEDWLPGVQARRYDHRQLPFENKAGLTLSLAYTEKQGGISTVDTTSRAERAEGRRYRLVGHKWFVAAPMADAAIVLAEAPSGPSAFLVPRFRLDETLNAARIQRLKSTIGLRGLGIAEIEYADAEGWLVGNEGDGTRLFTNALQGLQLDGALIACGVMRGALGLAVHHVRHRTVSGLRLIDQPLMSRVLADAAIDVAGATALSIRLALARDRADNDPIEDAFAKLLTPAARYWTARMAPAVTTECAECIGGNGYVEDGEIARYVRDAPAFGCWGGSSNQMALEVLAILDAAPEALDATLTELEKDLGKDASVSLDVIRGAAAACADDQGAARILVEQLAMTAAAAALHRFAPRAITDAFLDTRIGGTWRTGYGMLDGRFDARGIVDYAYPGI